MDYKRGLAKVEEGKQLAVQQAIREFPHDPEQPGRVGGAREGGCVSIVSL